MRTTTVWDWGFGVGGVGQPSGHRAQVEGHYYIIRQQKNNLPVMPLLRRFFPLRYLFSTTPKLFIITFDKMTGVLGRGGAVKARGEGEREKKNITLPYPTHHRRVYRTQVSNERHPFFQNHPSGREPVPLSQLLLPCYCLPAGEM